jgi:Calcineurin-like phosphoesterase
MQQRDPAPAARLWLAAVLAGLGAVLVLAGVSAVLRAPGGPAQQPAGGRTQAAVTTAPPTTPTAPGTAGPDASGDPSPSPGNPVLVGAGDIGRCDSTADEDTAALVERMPGTVFTLGDNAYDTGSADDYRDCFGPSWGRFRDRIAFPVPGNHDYETDGAAGYRGYFGATAVRDGATWYSADLAAWHVVVLDSTCARVDGGCRPDSPQVRWLTADLAANDARCTLALFHHPRFSSGYHGNDRAVGPFWDALYAGGADLVVNGHEHSYERFAPQDPSGARDEAHGIMELIAGTGGADLRAFNAPQPNSRIRASVAHGVLVLTLRPSGWTWAFTSVDGTFSDTGSGACH